MIDTLENWGEGEGLFEIACDGARCTTAVEIEGYWDDVIAYLRDHNWRYYKEDGGWRHLCPTCRAKEDFQEDPT